MSKRIQRINELLKRELGQILLREVEFPQGVLATITQVETSSDLREAKISISVMPEIKREKVLQILNRQIYNLQQKINKKLRMRPVPRIKFQEEKEVKQAARIEELLEKAGEEKN